MPSPSIAAAASRTTNSVSCALGGGRPSASATLDAPRVDEVGERAQQAPVAAFGSGRRELEHAPREHARVARVAERREHALDHRRRTVSPRGGLRRERLDELGLEPLHRAALERLGEPVAAREVVEDRRVRDADVARDVLEPDRLGPALAQPLLRGVEDQPLRLLGAAAHAAPLRFAGRRPPAVSPLPPLLTNCQYRVAYSVVNQG